MQNNMNNLFSSGIYNNQPSSNSYNQGIGSIFNQTSLTPKNGTRVKQYEPQKIRDDRGFGLLEFRHINVMKEYSEKSCDELRYEDYNLGRRPNPALQSTTNQSNISSNISSNTSITTSNVLTTSNMLPGPNNMLSNMTSVNNTLPVPSTTINSNTTSSTAWPFNQTSSATATDSFSLPTANAQRQPPALFTSTTQTNNQPSVPSTNVFSNVPQPSAPSTNVFSNVPQPNSNMPQPNNNIFANVPQPSAPNGNIFANVPQSSAPSTNIFSNVPQPNTPSNNIFSNVPQPSNNIFSNVPQPSGNIFSNVPQPAPTNTIFGNVPQPSGNIFQTTNPPVNEVTSQSFISNQSIFPQQKLDQSNMTQSPLLNPSVSCTQVDKSDPYGTKDMKFHFIEKELSPFQRLLAEPLVPSKLPVEHTLDYRSPESNKLLEVYFSPDLNEIRGMNRINNMTLIFPSKGKIEYLEPVSVSDLTVENVNKKILFSGSHVYLTDKPGEGLNKPARVTIEKVYPLSKTEEGMIIGKAEKYPSKGIQDRFIYDLKKDGVKEYEEYDCTRGLYIYKVKHF
ncbi:nucleoporin [Vairimorpha necatrix]|uniref:Nucleoporin n=1 Tax=Vairimorpha necatrix TaxID=6039 RepID=A0AAX4JCP8_9MICR